ncbi:diacylglycerol/lipid kinase family protein [Anaerosporobacter faecicola]|uniref:diacylglycerol/lipid kinase family protein n=1 Tax=Anaerosporobacter faecicola TaxID=2718714 RepID=UPI00143A2033|nr:YegS/Rv2252/BmrU family lipid kinase [Anaerosporobacter faecicola]
MKKLLFIYNPHAGKGKIKNSLSDIIEIFVKAGYEVTIYATQKRDDAKNIARERHQDFDLVVCSGGDGTLNEVTSGLMVSPHAPMIGYLPAGTTNDFASSMGIPKNMVKAAEAVVNGSPFAYDIGSLNDRYFTYVAGFGVFTNVSYETPQTTKNLLGRTAYILEGIKSLPSVTSYHVTVSFDDQVIEDDFIYGMVTNANSVGGFKGITGKDVGLDDGKFEVTLIKNPKNIVELQHIVNALLARDLSDKFIYSFHASNLDISCEEEISWTIDGEYGGTYTKMHLQNHQRALSYITTNTVEQHEIEQKESTNLLEEKIEESKAEGNS